MQTGDRGQGRPEAGADLIARARHDRAAFAELYDLYVRRVYAFCLVRSQTHEEAEDLTAQTFERALGAIRTYQDRGRPFSSWLLRIAANAIIDRARQRKREVAPGHMPGHQDAGLADPDGWVEQWEQAIWLQTHLETLPPNQQQVLHLRFFEDCSLREIAEQMERSEDAIKQLLRRALTGLRASLRVEAMTDG